MRHNTRPVRQGPSPTVPRNSNWSVNKRGNVHVSKINNRPTATKISDRAVKIGK